MPNRGGIYPDLNTLLKEDVLDILIQITPVDRPVMNMLSMDGVASQPFHQWLRQALTTRQDNAVAEGGAYDYDVQGSEPIVAARELNATQIFRKLVRISGTSQASDRYGVADQFERTSRERMIELSTDIEHALITGSLASGATNTARRLNGMIWSASLGTGQHSLILNTTLNEEKFNDLLESLWSNGVRARDVLVNSKMKRRISAFTQGSGGGGLTRTNFKEQNDLGLVNVVSVYESDFGLVEMHLSRDVPTNIISGTLPTLKDYVIAFDREMFRVAWLRRPFIEPTAKVADSMDAVLHAEGTLEYGHPSGSGWYLINNGF